MHNTVLVEVSYLRTEDSGNGKEIFSQICKILEIIHSICRKMS